MQTLLAVLFILSCHSVWKASVSVHASRAYVCEPQNSTQLTACNNQHWIHISSELYAPKRIGVPSCAVNLTGCNNYVRDHGLKANCNGPVQDGSSPCEEEVDFESVKFVQCLADADDLAVMLEYVCVPETSVLDMCSSFSLSQTSSSLYLASPGFPFSVADGQMCFCSVQGTRIKMEVIDVNIKADLQWSEPATPDSVDAVLTIESGGATVFDSNADCVGCNEIVQHNTNILSELGGSATNISLSYSDFGLPGQNVWINILSFGPELNVTCSSNPLPSNRIITTTTTSTTTTTTAAPPTTSTTTATTSKTTSTATTTTSSTSATTSTATTTTASPSETTSTATTTTASPSTTTSTATTTTASPSATTSTATTTSATPATTSTSTTTTPSTSATTSKTSKSSNNPVTPEGQVTQGPNLETTATQSTSATGNNGHGRGKAINREEDDDENDDTVLIVVLLLVMIILIAVTSILCVVIYRRRDKFGSLHMKSAVVSWFERTFQRRHHAQPDEEQNGGELQTYDDIVAASSDGLQMKDFRGEDTYAVPTNSSSGKQMEDFQEQDVYAVPTKRSKGQQIEDLRGQDVYAVPNKRAKAKPESRGVTPPETGSSESDTFQKAELHSAENTSHPEPLIDPGIYASHQQLVGHEVAKMKMERSLHSKNKTNDSHVPKEKRHLTNKENTQVPSVQAKQAENRDLDKDLEAKTRPKTHAHSDAVLKSAISDKEESKETNPKNQDDVNMNYRKRKSKEKTHNKKIVRDDELKDVKNTHQDSHNALKLSPEEGQMFEDLGIPQQSNMNHEKGLENDSDHHGNKIKGMSEDNCLYLDENAYSMV